MLERFKKNISVTYNHEKRIKDLEKQVDALIELNQAQVKLNNEFVKAIQRIELDRGISDFGVILKKDFMN